MEILEQVYRARQAYKADHHPAEPTVLELGMRQYVNLLRATAGDLMTTARPAAHASDPNVYVFGMRIEPLPLDSWLMVW